VEPFAYLRAEDEAASLLAAAKEGSSFIAGGTSLVDLMRLGVERPARVVDISSLPYGRIESTADGLSIGALVRNSDLSEHPLVKKGFPALSQSLSSGASPQLRNMATVGGNILQRTRCSYFRNSFPICNKRLPGTGCAAREGVNRGHAVLGGSENCVAVHPSDMCVALAAFDAIVHLRNQRGVRAVPLGLFHLLPEDHPDRETVLLPGELITHVVVPAVPFFERSAYVKARDRASYDFALASAAAALDVQGGTVRAARLALGGVGTKPWRCAEAERFLVGKLAVQPTYEEAARVALADAVPLPGNGFKVELARRTIVRALENAGALS
jgi:xanthine dehydrogenase YagS FAD-binding subunit